MTDKTPAKTASQQPANLDRDGKINPQKKQVGITAAFPPSPAYSPDTVAQPAQDKTAQRYGKGRAANESQTKPPNLDKKPNFKTANGRRVPLTDLLGYTATTKANSKHAMQLYV